MPWSSFSECWILSQVFHSPISPSSPWVPLHFLPFKWYHLHIWGCWYFWQSWFQLLFYSAWILHDMQICRWHHPYGRKWRRTKESLDESERKEWKCWLTTTFKTRRSWHLVLSLHGKQTRKMWRQCHVSFSWAPQSLWTVTAAMKLKNACSLEENVWETETVY